MEATPMEKPMMNRPTAAQITEYKTVQNADYAAYNSGREVPELVDYPAPQTEAWKIANPDIFAAITAWDEWDAAGTESIYQ
jgi:hypothetical protein